MESVGQFVCLLIT